MSVEASSEECWRKAAVNRRTLAVVLVMLFVIVAAGYQQEVSRANSDIANLNSLLQSQNSALDNRTAAFQNMSENNSALMLKVDNLTAIIGLNRSMILLMNDTTASQRGGNFSNPGFTLWNNFSAIHYAGYLAITIHGTNASDCLLEASWRAYVTQAWRFGSSPSILNSSLTTLNTPGSAVLPRQTSR